MDKSGTSSPPADQPLLPLHATQSPYPVPESSEFPTSPTSFRQGQPAGQPAGFGPSDQELEADIADPSSGAQFNEKGDVEAQTRPPVEPKTASEEDEAQALNWIVPVHNGVPPEKRRTVQERLNSTLLVAQEQQKIYAKRANIAGLAVNGAMFFQIIINALITGLSASTSNRHAQIGVSALGAIGTIVASFIVRVRGTREPERSQIHSQNLEKFIRELEAFILDEGLSRDRKWDPEVKHFRQEFDKLQTAAHQSENGQPMTKSP